MTAFLLRAGITTMTPSFRPLTTTTMPVLRRITPRHGEEPGGTATDTPQTSTESTEIITTDKELTGIPSKDIHVLYQEQG